MPLITIPTLVLRPDPTSAFALPTGSRIRFLDVDDEAAFIAALQNGVPAGYIAGLEMDHDLRTLLRRILDAVPDAHVVVGLENADPRRRVRTVVSDQVALVAPLRDEKRLEWAVSSARFEGRVEVVRRTAESRELDWLLDRATRLVLAERLPASEHPEPEDVTLVRSIQDLAERCGASQKTLRRRMRSHDLALGRFISLWKAVLVVRERFLGSETDVTPWPTVYARAGYTTNSGGRRLLKRKLGKYETEVKPDDLNELLDQLDALVAEGS